MENSYQRHLNKKEFLKKCDVQGESEGIETLLLKQFKRQIVLSATTALCWHLEVSKVELKGLLCHLKETPYFSKVLHDLRDQYLTFIWFAHSFFSWVCFSLFI